MKGISNLFSRISPDVSHIHKSRSYDLTDKVVVTEPSPSHSSGKESIKSSIGIGDFHSSSPQLGGRNKRDKGKDDSDMSEAVLKPKSADRFGPGSLHCSNPFLLAEMKSRQEKRVPTYHPPQAAEEKGPSEGVSILANVKLKATGLSQTLVSPTDAGQGEDAASHLSSTSTLTSSPGSPDPGGRLTPGLKIKPPPIAPKPRPKSVGGAAEMRLSGDFSNLSEGDSSKTVSSVSESGSQGATEAESGKGPLRVKSMFSLADQQDVDFKDTLLNGSQEQLHSVSTSSSNSSQLSNVSANASSPSDVEKNLFNAMDDVVNV